ncbi:MAG: hypothetical protein KAJ51_05465 [Thermoplasmata archaeon]|nr:hypothetical protein [Thermoplasmata archaeon]
MVQWIRFEGGQEICTVECPHCKKLLNNENDDKKIDVNVATEKEKGSLQLSALWDDYTHSMDGMTISDGEEVEMFCPHCNKSLISEDTCEDCGSTITMFRFSMGHIKICNRKGCKWHLRFLLSG